MNVREKSTDPTGPLATGTNQDITSILALHLYHEKIPWDQAVHTIQICCDHLDQSPHAGEDLQPIKGLSAFLKKANQHSIKCGVVTSDSTEQAENHLEKMNIRSYFHTVIGADQVEKGKPFPDMGYLACKEMGVPPVRVLMIGDTNGDMVLGKKLNALASIGMATHTTEDLSYLSDARHLVRDYTEIVIK